MAFIIWCLTYDYIFYLMLIFLILFSISLQKRVITVYSFLRLYFRLMNHFIFYIILFLVNKIWLCVWFLSFLSQVFSLPLLLFIWFFFFLDIILSYFGSEILNFIEIQFWLCICMCLSTIKIKPPKMNMYRQYFYFYFSLIYYLVITLKLK